MVKNLEKEKRVEEHELRFPRLKIWDEREMLII